MEPAGVGPEPAGKVRPVPVSPAHQSASRPRGAKWLRSAPGVTQANRNKRSSPSAVHGEQPGAHRFTDLRASADVTEARCRIPQLQIVGLGLTCYALKS